MWSTVRVYEMTEDWDESLLVHLDEGFLPEVQGLPGFVSYQCFEAAPRLFASVSVFDDRSSAEVANRLAARYVQAHLADRFPTPPEITAGRIRLHRSAR